MTTELLKPIDLKLERANEQIIMLQNEVASWIKQNPMKFKVDIENKI